MLEAYQDSAILSFKSYQLQFQAKFPFLMKYPQFRNMKLIFTYDEDSDTPGQSWQATSTVELNLAYFPEWEGLMCHDILVHEMAHLIAPLVYGNEDDFHGICWQTVVKILGFEPKTHYEIGL